MCKAKRNFIMACFNTVNTAVNDRLFFPREKRKCVREGRDGRARGVCRAVTLADGNSI